MIEPGTRKEKSTKGVAEKQEDTRGWLAKASFYLLAAVIVGVFILYLTKNLQCEQEARIFGIITVVVGIVMFVFGFYFGQNPNKN